MVNNNKLSKLKPHGRVDETVIDRLAEIWPEPREQLHFGGWKATYQLVEKLKLDKANRILDICCGEGGTACWLAKKYGRRVSGVDILNNAIEVARSKAKNLGVSDLVDFVCSDIFELPYPDSTFDVIYGQDPDGLAHKDRKLIFKELERVLKPHGRFAFQLWIPFLSVPDKKIKYFESITAKVGFPEMGRLSVNEFVEDLKEAGFTNIIIEDLSNLYEEHLRKMEDIFKQKLKSPDKWHNMLLKLIDDGYKIGVRIIAKVKKDLKDQIYRKELPKAEDLYFYGTGIYSPDYIFDFNTIAEEKKFRNLIFDYLNENFPKYNWNIKGEGVLASGTVDNYSPPKVGCFLSVNINQALLSKKFNIRINDKKYLDCHIDDAFIDIYHFNCAILHFILYIPNESWQDKEVLKRVRFFVQKHQHPIEEFGIDMESIFAPIITELNSIFTKVVKEIKPPVLKTPFLDFTQLSEEVPTKLFWTHSTIVAAMLEGFDPNTNHFQEILLNVNPKGIYNYSILPNIFAYVESGDSLICIPNVPDIRNRSPKVIIKEDWISWIAIQHYTWKTVWELDRGFYILLNVVTSHLKHKRAEQYRDVYAVNALINHIYLVLDTHKPRNVTSTYYSMDFIEKIRDAWRTDNILEAAISKMETLRDLISQLDEIENARRSKRLELFLTLLGVFTLGSLVLDFLGAMSFSDQVPYWISLFLGISIPFGFSLIAYKLLKD
ncbi:MAG: class I SAM-dependent methyltransferase [Promethearchaeota archaeon]